MESGDVEIYGTAENSAATIQQRVGEMHEAKYAGMHDS